MRKYIKIFTLLFVLTFVRIYLVNPASIHAASYDDTVSLYVGALGASNGAETTTSTRIKSDRLCIAESDVNIELSAVNAKYAFFCYDADNQYLGWSGWITASTFDVDGEAKVLYADTRFVRLMFSYSDGRTITKADIEEIDGCVSCQRLSEEAPETPTVVMTKGTLNSKTGLEVASATNGRTERLKLENQNIAITLGSLEVKYSVFYYDELGQYLSWSGWRTDAQLELSSENAVENAASVRILFAFKDSRTVTQSEAASLASCIQLADTTAPSEEEDENRLSVTLRKGALVGATGKDYAMTTRASTEKLDLTTNNISVKLGERNVRYAVFAYDAQGGYLGWTSWYTDAVREISRSDLPAGTVYVRIMLAYGDNRELGSEELDDLSDCVFMYAKETEEQEEKVREPVTLKKGALVGSTGKDYAMDTRAATEKLDITAKDITVKVGTLNAKFAVFSYDAQGGYLGWTSWYTNARFEIVREDLPEETVYVRITFAYGDNREIGSTELNELAGCVIVYAKANSGGEEKPSEPVTLKVGTLVGSTGKDYAMNTRATTERIDITAKDTTVKTGTLNAKYAVFCYDAGGGYLGWTSWYTDIRREINPADLPDGSVYVRITFAYADNRQIGITQLNELSECVLVYAKETGEEEEEERTREPVTLQTGALVGASGKDYPMTTRVSTGKLDVTTKDISVRIGTLNVKYAVFSYDAQGNYLGWSNWITDIKREINPLYLRDDTVQIRIMLSYGDNREVGSTELAELSDCVFVYAKEISGYALPEDLTLTSDGTVSFNVKESEAHTVMLGVYRQEVLSSFAAKKLNRGASSSSSSLLAVIPIKLKAGSKEYSMNISSVFDCSAEYYVSAKAVGSASEENAADMGIGQVVNSNTVFFVRPDQSLESPDTLTWSENAYGRAEWNAIEGAASYQVMLYANNEIVASRNINTTYFNFSSGWIDFDKITENNYTFTVTAMSGDITTVSNSVESVRSAVLSEPTSLDAVSIVTQPANKYASLNRNVSVTMKAKGIGLTYDWYVNDVLTVSGADDAIVNFTPDALGRVNVYAVAHDAFGNSVTSDTAVITVIDDSPVEHVITTQPQNLNIDEGQSGYIDLAVACHTLVDFSFQWYESYDNGETWEKSSTNIFVFVQGYRGLNGSLYRCEVTATAPTGVVVCTEMSDTAVLTVNPIPIVIYSDLADRYFVASTPSIDVEAMGENLTYTWMYKTDGMNAFAALPGETTDTISIEGISEETQFYCLIQNEDASVVSNTTTVYPGANPATDIQIYLSYTPLNPKHLAVGDQVRLFAILTPDDSDSKVTWKSSNPSVASVSKGKVTAKSFGTVSITASANGYQASYTVTVDSYLVEYNPNGGLFSDGTSKNITERIQSGNPPSFPFISKENDTFLGWSADGTTTVDANLRVTQDTMLIAKWEQTTEAEDDSLAIEQDLQSNQYARIGDMALFEVVVNGAKVKSYRWMVNEGSGWYAVNNGVANSGEKTRMEVEATADNNGYQYKVVVTSFKGEIVESNVSTLTTGTASVPEQTATEIRFTKQPENVTVTEGEDAVFSVEVDAENAEYEWQQLIDDQWIPVDHQQSAVMELTKVPFTANDCSYRCKVTANGVSKTSQMVLLTVKKQETYTVKYDANGGGFMDEDGGYTLEFKTESGIVGEYTLIEDVPKKEGAVFAGWQTEDGVSVTEGLNVTENVTIYAKWNAVETSSRFVIRTQPTDTVAVNGKETVLTVEAGLLGDDSFTVPDNVTYQWQVMGAEWTDIEGADQPSYSFVAATSMTGKKYRVVVSFGETTLESDPVTLTVNRELTFYWQLNSSEMIFEGDSVTLDVSVDTPDSQETVFTFKEVAPNGEETTIETQSGSWAASFTFTPDISKKGYGYYCIVTCLGQEIQSNTMMLDFYEFAQQPDSVEIWSDDFYWGMQPYQEVTIYSSLQNPPPLEETYYFWQRSYDCENWETDYSFEGEDGGTLQFFTEPTGPIYYRLNVNGVLSNIIEGYVSEEQWEDTCPYCGGMNGDHTPECPMYGDGDMCPDCGGMNGDHSPDCPMMAGGY